MKKFYDWEDVNKVLVESNLLVTKINNVIKSLGTSKRFTEEKLSEILHENCRSSLVQQILDELESKDCGELQIGINEGLTDVQVAGIKKDLERGAIITGFYNIPKSKSVDDRMGPQKFQFLKIAPDHAEIIWLPPSRKGKPYKSSEIGKIPQHDKSRLSSFDHVTRLKESLHYYVKHSDTIFLEDVDFKDLEVVDPTDGSWDDESGLMARQHKKRNRRDVEEEVKYPHKMYDPESGESVEVKDEKEHKKYAEKGWGHSKKESTELEEDNDGDWIEDNYQIVDEDNKGNPIIEFKGYQFKITLNKEGNFEKLERLDKGAPDKLTLQLVQSIRKRKPLKESTELEEKVYHIKHSYNILSSTPKSIATINKITKKDIENALSKLAGHKGKVVSLDIDGEYADVATDRGEIYIVESTEINEVLTAQQRAKMKLAFKKSKVKRMIARAKSLKRRASLVVLKKRALKQARNMFIKKMAKGRDKSDLSAAQKSNIEKRLKKMKLKIARVAKKLLKKVKAKERARKLK